MELFNKKPYIRDNIHDLRIFDMEYDMQIAVALPELFPKITSLEWRDEGERRFKTGGPYKSIYASMLRKWSNIKLLVDRTNHLNIAIHLLDSTLCDKLTHLEISLDDYTEAGGSGEFGDIVIHGDLL